MQEQTLRIEKLSLLDKRIGDFLHGYRQNIAILGNDEEEISYLLTKYFSTRQFPGLIKIHLSASYSNPKTFIAGLALGLLRQTFLSNDSLDNLICGPANQSLPLTSAYIKKILTKSTPTLLDTLEIINCYLNESKKKCLLIIEDFDLLAKLFSAPFKDFSKFIMLQPNCMVLVTALPKPAHKVLYAELNLLFGNFEKIYLNEVTFLETYNYVKSVVNNEQASPLMLAFLVNITGTNLAYCDILAKALKEKINLASEQEIVVSVFENTLYNKQSYLFQKFINKINRLHHLYKDADQLVKILLSLSQGYLRKSELESLHICQTKDLALKLSKLQELNYIDNYGNIYKIVDPLFSFWLSTVYSSYYVPVCADPYQCQHNWQKSLLQALSIFKEDFIKSKTKKVSELICLFKDDTLTIGNDKYRLPASKRSNIMACGDRGLHILVAEGKEIIFAGIMEQQAEDNDVAEFLTKGLSVKGKKVKKIFISLDKLTPAAKLTAKNNKIIAWDVNKVNRLLKVYNKPFIAQTEPSQI